MVVNKRILILVTLSVLAFNAFNNKVHADSIDSLGFEFSLPKALENFQIASKHITLLADWAFPEVENYEFNKNDWKHFSRVVESKILAGLNGEVITDVFKNDRLIITREFWYSYDKEEIALRQRITNLDKESINLISLIPLKLRGANALVFEGEKNTENWNVLVQKRLKNGLPITIKPTNNDEIEVDPFCVFNINNTNSPDLLIGYLSQMGHLAKFSLQFRKNKKGVEFSSLIANCEFDGSRIPSGGERTSQWVYIKSGYNSNTLINDFANSIGVYHDVKKPINKAPSVFCTWYFHGRNYNEEYFMEDIKSLKENRMPFDVFLIDDCWTNDDWGVWSPGPAFPSGINYLTDTIKELGYTPGIWTAPYSVDKDSKIALNHPEWLLKNNAGEFIEFGYTNKTWVFDPTFPGVTEYLEEVYRRLSKDYGFEYFKFDFMRSVFIFDDVKYYNPNVTKLEAYRMGLEAIRRGVGSDSYISICGGHFGGSLGIADSQRSGSDVVSIWEPKQVDAFRQNILRTWMNRLWHVDADALMVRKRDTPFHDKENNWSELALGKLTDDEAITSTLNQYLGGGMVSLSEYLVELQPERRSLYKHVIPSINTASLPLDIYNEIIPSKILTEVVPICEDLDPWNTLAVINWEETEKDMDVVLSKDVTKAIKSDKFIVSEFFSQKVLGIYSTGDQIDLGKIGFHASRLLRIAPWDGLTPTLTGTDLHFSGGGVEIKKWKALDNYVEGVLETKWDYPVNITVAFPAKNNKGYVLRKLEVQSQQNLFFIKNDTDEK